MESVMSTAQSAGTVGRLESETRLKVNSFLQMPAQITRVGVPMCAWK